MVSGWSMTTVAACALTSGVYRTAVTLKNGTQEIFPDSIVQRFTYTHVTQAGKTRHLLNVIKNGEVDMTIDFALSTGIAFNSSIMAVLSFRQNSLPIWWRCASSSVDATTL